MSRCYCCLCDMCVYNLELYPTQTPEEIQEYNPDCFNCDECYYYGEDNPKLSKTAFKRACERFKMSMYYIDLKARKARRKWTIKGEKKNDKKITKGRSNKT